MKKKCPAFIILGVIALVAALALAVTNALTAGPINQRAQAALREARQAVLAADTFEEVDSADEAVAVHAGKAGDALVGYTGVVTVSGYAGPVEVILGTDPQGGITGLSVGGASFAETAGLGARAKEPGFTDQFKEKTLPVALAKGSIDAITGATITSAAVVNGVNQAGAAIAAAAGFELGAAPAPVAEEAPAQIGEVAPGTYTGEAQGYQSAVKATVTVGADGLISAVSIASPDETPGFGTKVDGDEAFAAQFVGQKGPFTLKEGIDAVSGATITSNAAVEAVNTALIGEPAAPEVGAGTGVGEAQGYQSTVKATVEVGADGLITAVSIASADETPGFGTRVEGDEAFAAQFVGKTGPFSLGEGIDALGGATVTSTAAVEAVNTALQNVVPGGGDTLTIISETQAGTVAVNGEGQLVLTFPEGFKGDVNATFTLDEKGQITGATLTPVKTSTAVVEGNTATAQAKGYESQVKATVTVDDSGVITEVKLNTQNETEYFGMGVGDSAWPGKFVGKTGPFTLGEDGIDVYTNASFTSKAAVEAINDCLLGLSLSKGGAIPTSAQVEQEPEGEAPAAAAVVEGNTATAQAKGYESQVKATVTVDDSGVITEVKLNTQNETEYFGMGVGDSAWPGKFVGKTGPFTLGEDGIDVYTNASFTSKAAVAAINDCVSALAESRSAAPEAPAATEAPAAAEATEAPAPIQLTGTAQGARGEVKATLTVDDQGRVVSVAIASDNPVEGFNSRLLGSADFAAQFVGQTGPFVLGENIDAIGGATRSSQAAVEAVNKALGLEAEASVTAQGGADAPAAVEEAAPWVGMAQGLKGEVKATVTVDEKGLITSVAITSDNPVEGFNSRLLGSADFAAQFVGQVGPFVLGENIDAIGGATLSSQAAVEAVNKALASK